MQFTTVLALFVTAIGINAAPAVEKRIDAVPLSIYTGPGCNDGNPVIPVTTAYIPTDGSCFGISAILPGNTNSGMIRQTNLAQLPAGCRLVAWSDPYCSSQGTLTFSETGECGTFGAGRLILSARAVGTCA